MSVIRYNLDACIGCGLCIKVCPFDVFRYNAEHKKSVIAYPEDCVTCGQCYIYCPGGSLGLSHNAYAHTLAAYRAPAETGIRRDILIPAPPQGQSSPKEA